MKKHKKEQRPTSMPVSRRQFIGLSAASTAAFMIVPRHVLGGPGYRAPSDTVNIAVVGAGGKGTSDMLSVMTENIVAICDVDDTQMAGTLKRYSGMGDASIVEKFNKATKYRDFRIMLEKEKNNIDAVTVSTPDHTHAIIALTAMRAGKHAFVQKPLTHTVEEARLLAKVAKENKLVTQMGNQGHASEEARLINEWIWDGAIGDVREVHCWTNRPIWPQGIKRPTEIPSVPSTLDWDLWVGPAPFRPYHPAYAPFSWRGWWEYGTGALGDMGAHIIDHAYWALKLGLPDTVQASSTPFTDASYPIASKVHLTFPARGEMPPVKLSWYDGGLMPERPEELEPGRRMGETGGGVLFVGDKGKLMCSVYGSNPRLIPETKMRAYKRPEKTIPRSPGIHEEWIAGIKSGTETTTNFDYAAKLTESMLLGNIAIRMEDQNTILQYDSNKMEFTNLPEANAYLRKEYRPGWNLKG